MLLRPRQKLFVERSLRALDEHGNALGVAPTGAGKTFMLSAVAGDMVGDSDAKACVLAHRDELTEQNRGKFARVNPDLSTSVVDAKEKSWAGQVTFAMVPTLTRAANLDNLPALDLLVIDEAHHAAADSYRRIIDKALDRNPDCKVFGVTATPSRGDKKGLRPVFSNVSDQIRIGELIAAGHLVPPRTFVVDVGVQSDLGRVRKTVKFEWLRWDKGQPETAAYICEACEEPIAEHHKTAMLEAGERRATAESADPTTVGYHLSALYSPVGWLSWERIARSWEAAQGSDDAIRAFKNTILGETWVESGEAPDWQRLLDRKEDWAAGTVPANALFLTAGADVQKDRIEVDVWAWGRGLESWLIDHIVIEGGPGSEACWNGLTDLLGRTWQQANGSQMTIARLAIDTGYETPAVYGWARKVGFGQVAPVKGVEGFNRASPVSGPTFVDATIAGKRLRRGARLWTVAVSTFKSETYRFLRLERPTPEELAGGGTFPPGTLHLPGWIDSEWLKQLVAEQLVTVRNKRGFARLEWQKLRERNEALDCRVYARAAAWILGADRWSSSQWDELERQVAAPDAEVGKGNVSISRQSQPARQRRSVRSNYMK